MAALNTRELVFKQKPLHRPSLQELQQVIQESLSTNFENVTVEVTPCPNLTASPYNLVGAGLCGSPTILEVGGNPYLMPLVKREKLYDIPQISRQFMGEGKILIVGAGAGPFPLRNSNCEGIFNMGVSADGKLTNGSYTAVVSGEEEVCVLERIPDSEPRGALLLNLFVCRGEPGDVIKITCKKRTGEKDFMQCVREGLLEKYQDKCVGMGGLFLMKQGKAYQHVMRDFSKTPITTEEQLNQWLKFYEMPATLNAVGTLITHEHDLDLRLQHFHSFSFTNWGGHFHNDTTPEIAEYEAYINVAERVVRVDQPKETHKLGRD